MNPGLTILRMMVDRYRYLYAGFVVYLVLVSALSATVTLPSGAMALCALPFGVGILMTVFGFVSFEADIASNASAYSPWILRMPVRTSTLALWPISAVLVWSCFSWFIFANGFLRPAHLEAPILWPGLLIASIALSMQAILWRPFRYGQLRLIVALLVPISLIVFGIPQGPAISGEHSRTYLFGTICFASILLAYQGVVASRTTGADGHVTDKAKASEASGSRKIKPFKSPFEAQVWLEWQRQGRMLPILTAVGLTLFTLPALQRMSPGQAFVYQSTGTVGVYQGNTAQINAWISSSFPFLFWIPLLIATAIGMGARPSEVRGGDGGFHLYYSTRPLTSDQLYRAKMVAITRGVLAAAMVVAGFTAIWLFVSFPTTSPDSVPYYKTLFNPNSDGRTTSTVCASLVLLGIWIWRNQVVGSFLDFLPNRNIPRLYPILVVTNFMAIWIMYNELRTDKDGFGFERDFLYFVGFLLFIKFSTTILTAGRLFAFRQFTLEQKVRIYLPFLAITLAALVCANLALLSVSMTNPPPYLTHPGVDLSVILLVPFARPMIARYQLEMGRHR